MSVAILAAPSMYVKSCTLPQVKNPVQTRIFTQRNSQKPSKSTPTFTSKTNFDWASPSVLSWPQLLRRLLFASLQNTLLVGARCRHVCSLCF